MLAFTIGYKGKDFIYKNLSLPLRGFYTEIPVVESKECPSNALTVVTFGQSNSANSVDFITPDKSIPSNLLQFDWSSGRCFKYKEPLIGADGSKGNTITPFAIELAKTTESYLIIAPFGVGGTSVLNWAYGPMSHRLSYALDSISRSGLFISRVFFLSPGRERCQSTNHQQGILF